MKNRSKILICLIAVAIFATGFFQLTPPKAYISSYGLYSYESREQAENPDTVAGSESFMSGIRLVQQTSVIPPRTGVSFGMQYVIRGDSDEPVDVTETIIFPGSGLTNPETGKTLKVSPYQRRVYHDETILMGYSFDEDWEVAKGEWIFQVTVDGKRLIEKRFQVE